MWRFGRIVSGCVCMLCAAWGAYAFRDGEIPFEPLITFLGSFAIWITSEAKSDKEINTSPSKLHPHDVALGKKLRAAFDEQTRYRLRNHSFGQPYNDEWLDPLRQFSREWVGAQHEFENSDLEQISSSIRKFSDDIDEKLSLYSDIADNYPEHYFSIPTRTERGNDWFEKETIERVGIVNQLATELIANLDGFEKKFRELSPESFL